jgi:uncharacterized protein YqgQ
MVGFGLDLSALEKGAPEAYKLISSQTVAMSAEMKRSAREGAESFRLIDEALGIHVSRPLTRILTQEFPMLAQGLQSVLGAGIIGALGMAAFEGFEKAARAIEQAQKAEEEFQNASRKTATIFTDIMQSYEKAATLRSLSGLDKKLFEIDYTSVEQGAKKIDELAAAMVKEAQASQEAHKWTTELLAGIGDAAHVVFNSASSLGIEAIGKQFEELVQRFNELSKLDALHGTHESAKFVADQIDKAQKTLAAMESMKLSGSESTIGEILKFLPGQYRPQTGFSQEELDRQSKILAILKQIGEVLKAEDDDRTGQENEERKAAAAAAQLKSQQAIAALYKEMQSSISKLQPTTDPFVKIGAEIDGMREKALADLAAITAAAKDGLIPPEVLARSEAEFSAFVANLKRLKDEMDSDVFRSQLPKNTLPTAFTGASTPVSVAAPPVAPVLGSGGTAGAQFDTFSKDQAAQLKAAAAAYADLVTPQQKYQLVQQELNLLLEKGLIDQTAYTAAMQKASQQFVEAEDHLHKMQQDLQKLLERSDDARAGVQAFFLQLQVDSAQNGKFAFDLLNQGLKGFEDELTKAVFTGKAKWEDLFRSMAETAFKFSLNKGVSQLFQFAGGTSIGKSIGLDSLIPKVSGGAASGATLNAAASTLQTGSTTLMTAATELQAAATSLQAGGLAGGAGGGETGGFGDFLSSFAGFAGGTDDAPGGLAGVGEQGPELLNLPAGSSVTPSASLRSGGDTHQYFIDAKGSEIGVEEKIVRALQQAEPRFIGKALANFTEVQRRTAGQQR